MNANIPEKLLNANTIELSLAAKLDSEGIAETFSSGKTSIFLFTN